MPSLRQVFYPFTYHYSSTNFRGARIRCTRSHQQRLPKRKACWKMSRRKGTSRFRAGLDRSQQSNLNKEWEENNMQVCSKESQLATRLANVIFLSSHEDLHALCSRLSFFWSRVSHSHNLIVNQAQRNSMASHGGTTWRFLLMITWKAVTPGAKAWSGPKLT